MKHVRYLFAFLLTLAVFMLAACGTTGTVVTKRHFEPVKIDADLLDPNKCPWPSKEEHIILGTEQETSDYMLAGYEAWRCSETTRSSIKTQVERQAADVAKRNK